MGRFWVIGSACLVLAACGDSSSPGNIYSSYDLVSVNGVVLPILPSGGLNWQEGGIVLRKDGTYSATITIGFCGIVGCTTGHIVESGTFTLQDPATVILTNAADGSTDRLSWSDAGSLTGVVEIDGLPGMFTLVWRRHD